jgi:hypothetical protein
VADPYTIRIFVPDGNPEGLRIIDRMNWTGLGVAFPREEWPKIKQRAEFGRAGVYILNGRVTDDDLPTRRSHFADQGEYFVLFDQLIGFGDRYFGFVIIIVRDQLKLAAMNSTSSIRLMERRQYAVPHAETKGALLSLQGGGLPKHDAVVEHAWISVEGQGPEQAQDKEDRGSIYRFEKWVWHAVPLNRRPSRKN